MGAGWFEKSGHWLILALVAAGILAWQYSRHKEEWPESRWITGGMLVVVALGLYLVYSARR